MSVPTNRQEFKEYCLRRLGKPVINIHVDDLQVDDRIDDALKMFWDYHFDGTEKIYYKHQLTEQDIASKSITLPDNVMGAVSIFNLGLGYNSSNLFNMKYQILLNDLFVFNSESMVPYYMNMSRIQFLEQLLVGIKPVRFNRHTNVLHIDMDFTDVMPESFLVVEAYQVIDPDEFTDAWGDRWLCLYGTALIKRQWAENLKLYTNAKLPGGIMLNADKMYDEVIIEIEKLNKELISKFSYPVSDYIG
jgi:hypothetical protein